MRGAAKKIYSSARLLALTSKTFPSSRKMIQPAPPILGIWRSSYRKSGKVPFEPPTYNELPIPNGSWQKWYERENEKYNKHLTIGISFFILTIFMVSRVATFEFSPPPLPEDDMCAPKKQPKCV